MVCGTFVFGYDHDTPASIERALAFAVEAKLCSTHFTPLVPIPQTPLYNRLKSENRLINDPWWLTEDSRYGQVFFHPLHMTAEELSERCYDASYRFNAYRCIVKRAADLKANCKTPFKLGSFLAANMVARKRTAIR